MTTENDQTVDVTDDGWEWAIVEIFGHRRHAGRTREEERFGTKMLRIDVTMHRLRSYVPTISSQVGRVR